MIPHRPVYLRTYVYDSPDGEDCLKKTVHTAKVAGVAGFYFSIYDIVGLTRPKGAIAVMARSASFTFPAAMAGAVYASSSCVLGNMREKDGPLNHFVGGFLAGTIYGARVRSQGAGLTAGMLLGTVTSIIKYVKDHGITMVNVEVPVVAEGMLGNTIGPSNKLRAPKEF